MMLPVLCTTISVSVFGILFHLHRDDACLAALNGAIGYFVYLQAMQHGHASFIAIFLASISMSIYAETVARLLKRPASLFLVAALIPFVPGGRLFRLFLCMLSMDTTGAWYYGILTILESGAIALGILLVSSCMKLLPRKK